MSSEQSAAEAWSPPVTGTPCWVEIPASDLSRAKKFYAEVFNWKFRSDPKAAEYKDVAMFSFPDPRFERLGGGIKKTTDPEGKKGGGPIVYLYVESLEDVAKAIPAAGGKIIGDVTPEGSFGFYQLFEDTEGNVGGSYTTAKQ
ncbi:hypothetical protein GJ744_008456 [Endocarpon pusillum]|uniref:VOC domain-containing protein n=1 Tax=Endocarpon pusillum TaxID=364733 RepID=A0A8H7AL88_9EURO|nr:hypothetical protein GJ744_008456 [Endocarpon pusillum]